MFAFLSQPSAYKWLFPSKINASSLDEMALDGTFPSLDSLAPALVYAIGLSLIRLVLQTVILQPFAMYAMNLKYKHQEPVQLIDVAMKKKKKLSDAELKNLSEKLGKSLEEVTKYTWNLRRNKATTLKMQKFVEAVWRFAFYSAFCFVGYNTLFLPTRASWIENADNFWNDWPMHSLTPAIAFYYQVELGAYLHQLLWTEVSRSDALEMILHHFVTICLVVLSYLTNFTRIGTTILLLHDSADIFLESAKVFNYISKTPGRDWSKPICDVLFFTFAVTFFVTRLVFYPRHILYSVIITAQTQFGFSLCYWVFASMLSILQILHVFWFYLIARMIFMLLTTGIEKDVRSDDEEDFEEDPSMSKKED